MEKTHIGIIGLGANSRLRHVHGFRACQDVVIVAVCNRRPESTEAAARELGIRKTYARWEELIADPDIDAVPIGTWPHLHCPITLAALEEGKHVLTEARMALDADQARQMLDASQNHPELVCQIVPSPLGLKGNRVVRDFIERGYLIVKKRACPRLSPFFPLFFRPCRSPSPSSLGGALIVHYAKMFLDFGSPPSLLGGSHDSHRCEWKTGARSGAVPFRPGQRLICWKRFW